MLDDINILKQRDPWNILDVAGLQYMQAKFSIDVENGDHDNRDIKSIILVGMGGSSLATLIAKDWLKSESTLPIEILRSYDLPSYVGYNTLVIINSFSGDTEETVSCLTQARNNNAQIAIISAGGELIKQSIDNQIAHIKLDVDLESHNSAARMFVVYDLCAIIAILSHFNIVQAVKLSEITDLYEWLRGESLKWASNVPTIDNYAKQLALKAVGKTAIFYGGDLTSPLAYKWKISWNENAKNLAFWNTLPEFNHNEMLGWASHPVEKPFAVFDLVSNLEHPQVLKRFKLTDRFLSGLRPKSTTINLIGESIIAQLLWGCILADFTSIYLAILNGVNPIQTNLIEKFKQNLK
ncbi:MAG: glucose/mannose-6-phosphate isomerase [Patescibacteria group bacterium]|nr:glucose/mannose-6-phosphate isomerase [Patescibacteria group bacterium]